MKELTVLKTQVLIVGAGITGAGLARDLAMRGVGSIIVEKQDVNAGASGGNHGLLHSGARYIASDPATARECHAENQLLKRMAPHCIEATGGLFVAVAGDDENHIAGFADACRRCEIPATPLDPKEAREMEPALSDRLIAVYAVDDATIDPFKLCLDNIAFAQQHGGRLLHHSRVVGFEMDAGRIRQTHVRDELTGNMICIEAEVVVNAAGAWAGVVAGLAGAPIQMRYSKGSLLVTQHRISQRVINRLRPAASGDILAPGGTVSILGTTSERVDSPDAIYPEIHEVDAIIDEGAAMIPELAITRYIRAFCGVRPLLGGSERTSGAQDDRAISRGFALIDHARSPDPRANFITITGGKLTTYRLMAEKTADLVCSKIGVQAACRTHIEPLPNTVDARWTQPGLAPDMWLRKRLFDDVLLCECEMVPQSVVEEIVGTIKKQGGRPGLKAIGLRSRVGKGPCQGTFCSLRLAAHLYNRSYLVNHQGVTELRDFLRERWRGQQPLLWDTSLAQAELLEAMHCGLFGLEMEEK
ncbi:MAG: anaerobic glycerol-3-phosphate dehydrogenase subunit A [Desulfobacteraceae bacterium]|nr:MAG: anaerobic glycerol-3-phosphate dehydrogenase subunit A [Desulfobacteraceae bacterium]